MPSRYAVSATAAVSANTHSQVELRSVARGEPGRLRTIASSEAGGGSWRGKCTDSGKSSAVSGGGGKYGLLPRGCSGGSDTPRKRPPRTRLGQWLKGLVDAQSQSTGASRSIDSKFEFELGFAAREGHRR